MAIFQREEISRGGRDRTVTTVDVKVGANDRLHHARVFVGMADIILGTVAVFVQTPGLDNRTTF